MKDVVYPGVIRVLRAVMRLLRLRVEITGEEHLPAAGPAVVAANHQSFADFVIVGLPAVRRGRLVRFMAKEAVFRAPVAGALMRGMRHIPVDRRSGAPAARSALRALRQGELVGIYPEATIGHAFVLKEARDLRHGAAYLALATGVPIVPVAHWGLHRFFTVGPHGSLRRGRWVGVRVGEPLLPQPGESAPALTLRLHAALNTLVEDLVDAYPDPPADPAAAWWWPFSRGGGAPAPDVARELDRAAVAKADGVRLDGAGPRSQM